MEAGEAKPTRGDRAARWADTDVATTELTRPGAGFFVSREGDCMAQAKKAAPDWERIEAHYRARVLSVREIAAAHGISHTYINTRAKKFGWVRDLSKRIQGKADALVSTATVSSDVSTETALSDKAIVDANAQVIASVRLAHRSDISRSRSLVMSLLGEVEMQTADPELFDRLGELVVATEGDAESKLLEAYRRVISTPGRIDGMKKLADSLKTLIGLEREAYGITGGHDSGDGPAVTRIELVGLDDNGAG